MDELRSAGGTIRVQETTLETPLLTLIVYIHWGVEVNNNKCALVLFIQNLRQYYLYGTWREGEHNDFFDPPPVENWSVNKDPSNVVGCRVTCSSFSSCRNSWSCWAASSSCYSRSGRSTKGSSGKQLSSNKKENTVHWNPKLYVWLLYTVNCMLYAVHCIYLM